MMSQQTQIKTLKAHLALNVKNVEESITFYRKMLGIEPSKVRSGYAKFEDYLTGVNGSLQSSDSSRRQDALDSFRFGGNVADLSGLFANLYSEIGVPTVLLFDVPSEASEDTLLSLIS